MVLWHEAHRRRTYHKVLDTTDEYPQGRNSCLVLIWKSKFSGSVNFKFQRLCNGELAIASILDQLHEPVHIYRMLWRRCFIKDQCWPQYIYACLFLEKCGWCFTINHIKHTLRAKPKLSCTNMWIPYKFSPKSMERWIYSRKKLIHRGLIWKTSKGSVIDQRNSLAKRTGIQDWLVVSGYIWNGKPQQVN